MATIVEFRAAARPRIACSTGSSAEIVLFPGVRYERWAAEPAEKRGRNRSRDRLELVD